MTRTKGTGTALCALALLAGCGGSDDGPLLETSPIQTTIRTEGPNILVVALSAFRIDRLSAYGYERPTTPTLDRIAAEGILYETCIAPASWTVPSHASIFTGLYPRDHGATAATPQLAREFHTLAEVLWSEGYSTAGATNHQNVSGRAGLFQGFEDAVPLFARNRDATDNGADAGGGWLLDWLDGRSGSDQRFFVYLNYREAGFPYDLDPAHDSRFLSADADPAAVTEVKSWRRPHDVAYMLGVAEHAISDAQLSIMSDLYDGEVSYVDARLGELIAGLEQRGLLSNTVIALVGDQGEHLGEHGMLEHKMSLYEELVRVPLILRYPSTLPSDRRIAAQVQSLDLFATLLDLAGIEVGWPISAIPLPLQDGEGAGRTHTFATFADPSNFLGPVEKRFPGTDVNRFRRALSMVRGPRYKLIRGSRGPDELYDLVEDPAEMRNVSGDRPGPRADLAERLKQFETVAP